MRFTILIHYLKNMRVDKVIDQIVSLIDFLLEARVLLGRVDQAILLGSEPTATAGKRAYELAIGASGVHGGGLLVVGAIVCFHSAGRVEHHVTTRRLALELNVCAAQQTEW